MLHGQPWHTREQAAALTHVLIHCKKRMVGFSQPQKPGMALNKPPHLLAKPQFTAA